MKKVRALSFILCFFILTSCIGGFASAAGETQTYDMTFDVNTEEELKTAIGTNSSTAINVLINVQTDLQISEDIDFGGYFQNIVITSGNRATITLDNCILCDGEFTGNAYDEQTLTFENININLSGEEAGLVIQNMGFTVNFRNVTINASENTGSLIRPGQSTRYRTVAVNVYSGTIISSTNGIIDSGFVGYSPSLNIYPEGDIYISGTTGVDTVNIYPVADGCTLSTATMGGSDISIPTEGNTASSFTYSSPLEITMASDSSDSSSLYTASLTSNSYEVQPGDSFNVTLSLAGDAFDGASFILHYNKAAVQITSIALVDGTYAPELSTGYEYDNDKGIAVITLEGCNVSASESGTTLATIIFKALEDGDSGIEIYEAKAIPEGETASITAGTTPITITVETLCYGVLADDYANGYSLIYYSPASALEDGAVMTYDGEAMYFLNDGSDNGTWLYLAKLENGLAESDFASAPGTVYTVNQNGDVNSDGDVDIADAQIACDIWREKHTGFEKATMLMWLNSDITGEANAITAEDVLAIQTVIHNQAFGIEA